MAGPVDVTANAGDTVSFQCIVGGRYDNLHTNQSFDIMFPLVVNFS